jgi:hypothetical protein
MTSSATTFEIHPLEVGSMENFIYIIHDNSTNQAAVVDPGWDMCKVLRFCVLWRLRPDLKSFKFALAKTSNIFC